ncbi:hypothetical protein [Paenibacillus sp. YPG26]|uniref:hypothetical protein n=1 Tax=Paenibacillus sp. YPG26 TaxID=2878915 RepID=UPI00203E2923|nr:hypothetical protein [Paenibacillus sp. YPG26]USB31955.1 hypothetical protein LDO05_11440 [Paenibacillus sp. YPG26]
MDVEGLKKFVTEKRLEERSVKSFWNYFNNFEKEHNKEFQKSFPDFTASELDLSIGTVALRITNWPEDGYNHVVVTLELHYRNLYAGRYTIEFTLFGEVEDDSLSIF